MKGLISVIVPVYNGEKFLSQCLSSIAGQTYRELEILVVDDGSTDGSAQIGRQWQEKDGRIRLLTQENKGVSAARNLGLKEAAGEYIAFVDADDWILPDMLSGQLACLEREASDMVLDGFAEVGEQEREFFFSGGDQEIKSSQDFPGGQDFSAASGCVSVDAKTYVGEYLLRGSTRCWSILFTRKAVEGAWFTPGLSIGEDLLFLMDLLPGLGRVSVRETRDYCYYRNEKGAMFSGFKPSYMDQLTCWQQARKRMEVLWPEYLAQIDLDLFQAALLVAGKLAVSGRATKTAGNDLTDCLQTAHAEACGAWKRLGRNGRKALPVGYRIKGPVFLYAPGIYLKLYHIWKGLE